MENRKITFIGAGNMAHAIIAGLVRKGYPAEFITVCSPNTTRRDVLAKTYGINSQHDNIRHAQEADVIVLAVKPQMMAEVCDALRPQLNFDQKLVLSIAAGMSVSRFYALLQDNLNIIRIMPNTPSLVGQGVSGMFAPEHVSQPDREFATSLMECVGKVCWVDNESGINDIIAIAGSAPAYFFLFMESMQQEAERLGFDSETARELVLQAAIGSAKLAETQKDLPFAILREQVTSKGGTTAEALRIFYEGNLPEIVSNAMQGAIRRAQEMETLF
ncbi:pyrroline-5-carboxylate reductase [Xenorhabdus szentirmaii]|uniref:Pyrroline-5-carboxylate reductase n=1 Tax=Xenorhabdus szentirmaii DSM 16338 TaxID=1427518 RepID=W1IVI5_9GAMM|nr:MULTISPECIES: pyrroline-5-carboxylate reductase [Xenorhabdus]MBD2781064.1 pyrroline-5-carboxylate reductase [Xenorhabdus sp. 38]MBD2805868.1 pyrroline-5-carboxylate reductase [Xenorhabdus sp. ZM]MBD2822044.1 pyrroline-5-carboxylate reductase [Xenorhabdus sp. 42]PHM31483.1 pyrroline-5-carboxylate reductase [Xenorhabdus szentirmaii DSM 16338]PHM42135.1 pyrroline-5-carboxylate reductase [Xenorhabdus szentirmaii]